MPTFQKATRIYHEKLILISIALGNTWASDFKMQIFLGYQRIIIMTEPTGFIRMYDSDTIMQGYLPQWFTLNAHFLSTVFEECWWTLLHDMLNPESSLQILEESFHERHKVSSSPNVPRHCLFDDYHKQSEL